jgi:deazaflavin-dependent oxidoreductase (nitroreductase family)
MTDPRFDIRPPEWLKDVNAQILADPQATAVLTVVGRRSGTPRRTPVTLYENDGARYLVGGFPGADWVRNVRAADDAHLAHNGREERVRLVELDAADAEPVLRAWPTVTPDGVAIMRDAGVIPDITPDALAAVAGVCPVFRVESVTDDLLAIYRDYLACLNYRRWDDLGRFVADGVVHNGKQLGLSGYRAMLESDTRAIPDLQFNADLLIADNQIVSCRLLFHCTPQEAFLGFEPTGQRISFAEHVFYRFEDRKITQVWSLIDREAIRAAAQPASD